MQLEDFVNTINSKEDFVNFLKLFLNDYSNNISEWENNKLESYLNGIYGFTMDIEGFLGFETNNLKPTWKLFAQILLAARVYE